MTSLGVNIDHIANVREARKTNEPDPVKISLLAELGGADGITVHLREDRRHIQDKDLKLLKNTLVTSLNLEMAATEEMFAIAKKINPSMITLVPEKREEITTEGGLDVIKNFDNLSHHINKFLALDIPISVFIDPIFEQIQAVKKLNASFIELHTGSYATSEMNNKVIELAKIKESVHFAKDIGLNVNAGHGLTYQNVEPIAAIEGISELNIGHSIISRSLSVGLKEAVKEMKYLILNPRKDFIY